MVGTVTQIVPEEVERDGEPIPIIEQPRRKELSLDIPDEAQGGTPEDLESWKFHGLASLAVTDSIMILVESNCCRCDWDVHYSVRDSKANTLMFTAVEELHCCYFGSLQNVVIRDLQKTAVARVCYKEKNCFAKKMILAVYAPPNLLVGTVEENSNFFFASKTDFKIHNSDGRIVFYVEYQKACMTCFGCRPYFSVKSEDRKTEVAKILEKTKEGLRLQFNVKMGITSKVLLSGFCIGLIHKPYNQKLEENTEEELLKRNFR